MKSVLFRLFRKYFLKTHKYPTSTLIHKKNGGIVFEIEFNWYDEELEPVSIVRELKSNKVFSIRSNEMLEFKEYTGSDPNAGAGFV